MKILLYSQVAHMGGSFGLLFQLARHLSKQHTVIMSAPYIAPEWRDEISNHNQITFTLAEEILPITSSFDVALLHLPFSMDDIGRSFFRKKILVVMEIMILHPLNFLSGELDSFQKAIYLHDEQLSPLLHHFPREQCTKLSIINNIDFSPEFKKTRNIASIGASAYKHNIQKALHMLFKTWGFNAYIIFGKTEKVTLPWYFEKFMEYLISHKRMLFPGIEWDKQKLYADFDCLFHIPEKGNGTSIVVSDALACGKMIVLSSLKEYRDAYGKIHGVYFADDLKYNLSKIMRRYNKEEFQRIQSGYFKIYNRELILTQWEETLLN